MTEITSRLSGALADRYRIERRLGEGGMATVYLAEDLKHKRNVAVKVLRPELAAVLGADRFVQEITTTASLQHPNILPLFDSGEADGFLYYVMPYIEGETLRNRLDRDTQLGIDEAVKIAVEVAEALDAAHQQGVIHRDIKPENILLHNGRPMVADFGIALAVSAAAGGRMTETGLSLGTPHYMSPEQATAEKELNARSDVYSLGSVLYEMLAGEPPHMGNTAQQIIMKIVTDAARPVTDLRKSVPPHVAATVAKSLEKLPADRFDSARAFADALGDATFTTPLSARRAVGVVGGASGPRWSTLGAAAAGIAVLAGAAGWLLRPVPTVPIRPVEFAIQSDSTHTILFSDIAISPDGSLIVYQAIDLSSDRADGYSTDGTVALYRRSIDNVQAQLIPGTEGGANPVFSPDGTQLGFTVEGAIKRISLNGGSPVTVADFAGFLFAVTWTDADEIVFSTWGPSGIFTVPATGGTPKRHERLSAFADTVGRVSNLHAVAGTDAVLLGPYGGFCVRCGVEGAFFYGASLSGDRQPRAIASGISGFVSMGNLFYVTADGALLRQPFDASTLDTIGPATRVTEQLWLDAGGQPLIAVSGTGTVVYLEGVQGGRELLWLDRQGGSRPLLSDRMFWLPRFSPDGSRVAFGETDLDEDLWIHDLRAGTTSRVTLDGLGNNDVVWSPDGDRLAFSRDLRVKDLYAVSAVGAVEEPTVLLSMDGIQWTTDWSPDGTSLVFTQANDDNEDIWIAPLDGAGEPRPIVASQYQEGAGRVSPDGRWLAYHSNRSGRFEIYVQAFPEPAQQQLVSPDGGEDPMWSRDGRELFYWNPQRQLISLRVSTGDDLTVERRDVLFQFPGYMVTGHAQYDVHPDGQGFVVVRGAIQSRLIVSLDAAGR
jgi:serine/threonine-protein kinase